MYILFVYEGRATQINKNKISVELAVLLDLYSCACDNKHLKHNNTKNKNEILTKINEYFFNRP